MFPIRRALVLGFLAALALLPALAWSDHVTAPTASPTSAPGSVASGGAAPAKRLAGVLSAGGRVAIVPIDREIDDMELVTFRHRVEKALADGADVVVVELSTPGGRVDSSLQISKFLKNLNKPTLAWVHNEAYSGGTIVAAACNNIVMARSSQIGDCAPIALGQTLGETERAKALSPILAEFEDSAQKNYPGKYPIFQAMCQRGVRVYEIARKDGGAPDHCFVDQADYAVMVDDQSPQEAKAQTAMDPSPNIEAERGRWQLVAEVPPHHKPSDLVTLNRDDAIACGLALDDTVNDESDLRQKLAAISVTRYDLTWIQMTAYWLSLPPVRALLVLIFMVGAYLEFHAPGVTVPGVVAVLALIGLLGAPYVLGLAAIWHIVLFVVGLALLITEVFFTTGTIVPGVVGVICMFAGLVLAVVPLGSGGMGLPGRQEAEQLQWSVISVLGGVFAAAIAFYVLSQYLGEFPLFRRLVLKSPPPQPPQPGELTGGPSGHSAPGGRPVESENATPVSGHEVIGAGQIAPKMTGRVVIALRPSGRIEVVGRLVDAVSRGEWIEVGRPVRVIEVMGNRIVVEEISATSAY